MNHTLRQRDALRGGHVALRMVPRSTPIFRAPERNHPLCRGLTIGSWFVAVVVMLAGLLVGTLAVIGWWQS